MRFYHLAQGKVEMRKVGDYLINLQLKCGR